MFVDKLNYPVVEPKSLLVCKCATKISVQTWKDGKVPEKEEVTMRNRRCFTLIYLLRENRKSQANIMEMQIECILISALLHIGSIKLN